ncbi:hypothetical protein [Pelagibacterium lacus]|uniref:Uncharacterized protein n=1 Tax=Pelagibacterium lacus TaxID=2282655 RepID=A0A369VZ45_9HYPH|nr:hypothetical protein [Pelagibacterium lacus]RDE07674.1 hypothetical protein DVH29_15445 [Pelagibacterium lacus]
MLSRFKTPLIAILLGVLPYFIFVGSSQTITVNGAVVRDEQFNLLGIVLAVVGLWLAFTVLRPSAPGDVVRKALAGIAALLCLVQLAASADIIRPLDWLTPDADLPPLAYSGLSTENRNFVDGIVERGNMDDVVRDLMNRSVFTLDDAHQHMDYADICHDGRYRIDYDALVALFSVLPTAQQDEITQRAADLRRPAPTLEDCSPQRTNYAMGELVDDMNQQIDMITILRDGYVALNP